RQPWRGDFKPAPPSDRRATGRFGYSHHINHWTNWRDDAAQRHRTSTSLSAQKMNEEFVVSNGVFPNGRDCAGRTTDSALCTSPARLEPLRCAVGRRNAAPAAAHVTSDERGC